MQNYRKVANISFVTDTYNLKKTMLKTPTRYDTDNIGNQTR